MSAQITIFFKSDSGFFKHKEILFKRELSSSFLRHSCFYILAPELRSILCFKDKLVT